MRKLFIFGFIAACLTTSCSSNSDYKKGEFFSLEELYSNKTLTSDDLLNISYWNNNEVVYDKNNKEVDESTFTIKELTTLSDETKDSIIENYKVILLDKSKDNLDVRNNIDNLDISKYCGVYNGYYAIRFNDLVDGCTAIEEVIVGDYMFHYPILNGEKVQLFKFNE